MHGLLCGCENLYLYARTFVYMRWKILRYTHTHIRIKGNISVGSTAIYCECVCVCFRTHILPVNFFNGISSRFPILMRQCNIMCVRRSKNEIAFVYMRMNMGALSIDNHTNYNDDHHDGRDDEMVMET